MGLFFKNVDWQDVVGSQVANLKLDLLFGKTDFPCPVRDWQQSLKR
jgi:hypothetical protein